MSRYFEELESTLSDNDIMDSPSVIFNFDESGFPLDPKSPLVVCRRGQQHPSSLSSGNKLQITVLTCCNAAGYVIPPFVIFSGKIFKQELTNGEIPETMYGLSSSGWIDSELFDTWFQNHFLAYAPASRPLLLILDGHFNPATLKRAAEPNTTHKTQPLDKGCFAPLKCYWREQCHAYLSANKRKVITRFQFSELFSRAWKKGMTAHNIKAGFKTTGIYPYNPEAAIQRKAASPHPSLCQRTGLQYIPFYSTATPRHRRVRCTSPDSSLVAQESVSSHEICVSSSVMSDDSNTDITLNDFTKEELTRFKKRKEEGYDIPGDKRYELWLKQFPRHSTPYFNESQIDSPVGAPLIHMSTMSCILKSKTKEIKLPKPKQCSSTRVLTSSENLRMLEEKQRKNEEELMAKEKRKQEREAKKLLKLSKLL